MSYTQNIPQDSSENMEISTGASELVKVSASNIEDVNSDLSQAQTFMDSDEEGIVKSKLTSEEKKEGDKKYFFSSEESAKKTVIHARNMQYFSDKRNRDKAYKEIKHIVALADLGYYFQLNLPEVFEGFQDFISSQDKDKFSDDEIEKILKLGKPFILSYVASEDCDKFDKDTFKAYIYWYLSALNVDAAEGYTKKVEDIFHTTVSFQEFDKDADEKYKFSEHLKYGFGKERENHIKCKVIVEEIAINFVNVAKAIKKYMPKISEFERLKIYEIAFDMILNAYQESSKEDEDSIVKQQKTFLQVEVTQKMRQRSLFECALTPTRQTMDLILKHLSQKKAMDMFIESMLFIAQVDHLVLDFITDTLELEETDGFQLQSKIYELSISNEEESNYIYGKLAVKFTKEILKIYLHGTSFGNQKNEEACYSILANSPDIQQIILEAINSPKYLSSKRIMESIDEKHLDRKITDFEDQTFMLSLFILYMIRKNHPEIPQSHFQQFDDLNIEAKAEEKRSIYQALKEILEKEDEQYID